MDIRVKIRKTYDLISLTFDMVANNRKLILPTVVGLIIALIVISNAFVLVESSREDFFNEIVFSSENIDNQFSSDVSVVLSAYYPDIIGPSRFTNFSHYDGITDIAIQDCDYNNYISEYFWFSELGISFRKTETSSSLVNTIIKISSSPNLFNELEKYMTVNNMGGLPQNSSEILIIRPNVTSASESYNTDIHPLAINSTITLTLPYESKYWAQIPESFNPNKTVKIVGIIDLFAPSYIYSEVDTIGHVLAKYLNHSWTSSILLTQPTFAYEIFQEVYHEHIFQLLEVYSSQLGIKHMEGKIFLNHTYYDAYNPKFEFINIENFIDGLSDEFESWGYNAIIHSNVLNGIRAYMGQRTNLLVMLFLVGSPVLAVSFFLMLYSFELIKRQKNKQLGIIKTRGGSWKQIVFVLYGEMVLATIIAAIIAFFLSILLGNLALRSTNYIEFLGKQINIRASITILLILIFIGILSALIINIHRIIKTAREDIEEAIIPVETISPFWKRYYLDIIIFVVGIIVWIGMIFLMRSLIGTELSKNVAIQVFFIIAPFLIFVGSILIIGRLFYFFIKVLAKLSWKIDWGILPFAINNILRYKHAANRAGLLLTLAVSFSIISSSLIFSLDQTENLRLYCLTGSDMSISFDESIVQRDLYRYHWEWEDSVDLNTINLIRENISHVSSVSTIFKASAFALPGRGITEMLHYHFLFVDTKTYGDTVTNRPEFLLSNDLNHLLGKINTTGTVLMYQKNLNAIGARIGHQVFLPIYSNFYGWNTNRSWRVQGTFGYWPNLFPNASSNYETEFWMIGSFELLERMIHNLFFITNTVEASCIIKLDSPTNAEKVAESIESLTGYSPFVSSIASDDYEDSFSRRFNLSVLNTNVIITSLVAIICMIMFSFYISLERGKEIGIERALGITRSQTTRLFLIETSVILIFGIFFGFVTGMLFTAIFFQITQIGTLATPFVIVYPIEIIPLLLGIFILACLGTLFPAHMASRTDISRILKVE